MYPCEEYPYRTTLVKEPNEPWKVLEYNCLYAEKEDPLEILPIGEPGIVLTVVSKSQIVPNMIEDPIKEFIDSNLRNTSSRRQQASRRLTRFCSTVAFPPS